MAYKYVKFTSIPTKTKGHHIKVHYSKNGDVKKFPTNVFIQKLTAEQKRLINIGGVKYNWFQKGDYERLNRIAENIDEIVQKYFDEYQSKPARDKLIKLVNQSQTSEIVGDGNDSHNISTNESQKLTEILQFYIEDKEKSLDIKFGDPKKVRKKLERYRTMHKVLIYYEKNSLNKLITINDLTEENFWIKLINYLLFDKPLSEKFYRTSSSHKLSEIQGDSDFVYGHGMSNNTLDKWLGDLNTAFNKMISNTSLTQELPLIKKTIKDAKESLQVVTYENKKASLRLKEYSFLKSEKFEKKITDDILDNKKITKRNLIKIKDMFVAMTILGCRYEDFLKFNKFDFIEASQRAGKTQNKYIANINNTVTEIFKKYNYNFKMSNQNFNDRVKILFKQFYSIYKSEGYISEIDLLFVEENWRGRYSKRVVKEKYELISAHTTRRSFACIAYYDSKDKIDKKIIMQYTGHKSEREFDKYIGLQIEEATKKKVADLFD